MMNGCDCAGERGAGASASPFFRDGAVLRGRLVEERYSDSGELVDSRGIGARRNSDYGGEGRGTSPSIRRIFWDLAFRKGE